MDTSPPFQTQRSYNATPYATSGHLYPTHLSSQQSREAIAEASRSCPERQHSRTKKIRISGHKYPQPVVIFRSLGRTWTRVRSCRSASAPARSLPPFVARLPAATTRRHASRTATEQTSPRPNRRPRAQAAMTAGPVKRGRASSRRLARPVVAVNQMLWRHSSEVLRGNARGRENARGHGIANGHASARRRRWLRVTALGTSAAPCRPLRPSPTSARVRCHT